MQDQLLAAIADNRHDQILTCLDQLSFTRNSPNAKVRVRQTLDKDQFQALLQILLQRSNPTLKQTRSRELHRIGINSDLLHDDHTRTLLAMVLILSGAAPELISRYLPAQAKQWPSWIDRTFGPFLQQRVKRRQWSSLQRHINSLSSLLSSSSSSSSASNSMSVNGWTPLLWHLQVQKLLVWDVSRRQFLFNTLQQPNVQERMVQLPAQPETFDLLIRAHLQERDLQGARSVVEQRESLGYSSSAHMYACLLQGYKALGGHKDIYNLVLAESNSPLRGNVEVDNALLGLYMADGQLEEAWGYFQTRFQLPHSPPNSNTLSVPTPDTYIILWRGLAQRPAALRPRNISASALWTCMQATSPEFKMGQSLVSAILDEAVMGRGAFEEARQLLKKLDQDQNPFELPLDLSQRLSKTKLHNALLQGILKYRGLASGLDYLRDHQLQLNADTWWLIVDSWAAEPGIPSDQVARLIDALVQAKELPKPDAKRLRSTFASYLRQNQKNLPAQLSADQPSSLPQFPPQNVVKVASPHLMEEFARPPSALIVAQMQHIADTRFDVSTPQLLWSILRDRVVLTGMRPTSSHLLPILSSYGYMGDLAGAESVVRHGQEKLDIAPDPMLYTKLMQVMLKQGKAAQAVALLHQMEHKHLPLDVRSYLPLMQQLAAKGSIGQVRRLFNQATNKSLGSPVTPKERLLLINTLFNALHNAGRRTESVQLYLEAQQVLHEALIKTDPPFLVEGTLMESMKQAWRSFKKLEGKLSDPGAESVRAAKDLALANFGKARQLRVARFESYKRLWDLVQEHSSR